MDTKRPPTFSVDGLTRDRFFRLCGRNGLRQQTVSAAKCAGIAAVAAQGVQPLVRNKVTQNSPDSRMSGLSAPQDAHTGLALYRSAPFVAKGYVSSKIYFLL